MRVVHPVLKNDYKIKLGESFYLHSWENDSQIAAFESVFVISTEDLDLFKKM